MRSSRRRRGEVYEIEFAPKGTDRLRGIVEAYELSSYDRATFLVKSAAVGRRIERVRSRTPALGLEERREVSVLPWIGLAEEEYRSVAEALAK